MAEANQLEECCSVDVRVQLPRAVAAEVEEVQRRDPEFLSRIVLYGLTRRVIYRCLSEGISDGP
jgi:hypothetical protein